MKWFLVVLSVMFSTVSLADEIKWLDYEDARELKSDKPIFVFAKMRFCSTCIAMEDNELSDPAFVAMINDNFIPVKETINFGFSRFVFDDLKDKNGDTLKFRGFPSVMIVQGDDYALSQGYKSSKGLTSLLSKVLELDADAGESAGH